VTVRRLAGTLLTSLVMLAGGLAPARAASITNPSTANLGSAPTGSSTLSAQLGTVTVSNGLLSLLSSATASVLCSAFTTGGGTANETIPAADIYYWSGPATASSGVASQTPGQLTAANAQSCGTQITAFTMGGLGLGASVSWNPTIVVHIPAAAVVGTYTGTITHSVA
jgi:hypothetical protein